MQVKIEITEKNCGLLAAFFSQQGIYGFWDVTGSGGYGPAAVAMVRGDSIGELAMVDAVRWAEWLQGHYAACEAYNRRLEAIASGKLDPEPDWV